MSQSVTQLTQLFDETGRAHHQAFLDTDGDDPDWPAWYADYLVERLPDLLGRRVEADAIASDLEFLAAEAAENAPEQSWQTYYASYFTEKYT